MTARKIITNTQQKALEWLIANGGDGSITNGTVKAGDSELRQRRDTWVLLRDAQRVEFYIGDYCDDRIRVIS